MYTKYCWNYIPGVCLNIQPMKIDRQMSSSPVINRTGVVIQTYILEFDQLKTS